MSEIVFQVVAFGFEHIVVFVFDLPTAAAVSNNGFDGSLRDGEVGDPGVFVELCPRIFPGQGQFTPVDVQRGLVAPPRQLVRIALGVDFAILPIPMPLLTRSQAPIGGQEINHLVQSPMRVGLAHQHEV